MSLQIAKRPPVPSHRIPCLVAFFMLSPVAWADAETLTVFADASHDSFLQTEQSEHIGDKIIWNSDLETESGERIGTASGHCTQLDAAKNFFCSAVIDLEDRGLISWQGVQRTEPEESTFPLNGGSGEFAGIMGELHSRPVEDRARFRYEIEYHLPSR